MNRTLFYYIFVILIIRLFLCVWIVQKDPTVPWESDSRVYYQLAHSIISDGTFQTAHKPEIFRTPGYPLFLAGVFKIFDDSFLTIIFIQVLLSCLSIFLVYKIAERIWKDDRLALIAAIIYSLDPWSFQISLYIGSDTLFTVMVLGFALMALHLLANAQVKTRWYVLSVIVLAACTFTRPLMYYFIFVFASFLVFDKRSWKALALVIVIYALLVGGWTVRNYYKTQAAVFATNTQHLYWNYGGKIRGMLNHTNSDEEDTKISLMAIQKQKISEKAMVDFCDQEARKMLSEHPFLFIKAFFSGMYSSVWSPGTLFLRDHIAGHNNILREAIKWFGISYLLACYVVALWGIIQVILNRNLSSKNLFLLALLLYLIVFCATPVGYYRFRVPFWPFICLFAGYAIRNLRRAL